MIKLSARLQAVASYVNSEAKIVDIGCDHALLDVYLTSNYPNLKAIAADIREGALKQAKSNVLRYNAEDKIDLRLGDGLEVVSKDEINTIVISGLGGPKIIDILKSNQDKLLNVSDIIIQTNTDYYDVRKNICSLGYFIKDEVLVKENDIIYLIIHFEKGKRKYNKKDYLFGPYLRVTKDSLFRELVSNEISKKEILYNLIPHKYILKKGQIKTELTQLKSAIK